jgi:hypothetical protein
MSRSRFGLGVVALGVAALVITGSAVALSSGKVFYESGKKSKTPHLLLTVSHGKVTTVSWKIKEPCPGLQSLGPASAIQKLNAVIKHGHFSKKVHAIIGSSPVANSTEDTTIKGTISGGHATVTVSDDRFYASYGECLGSHKFTATKTAAFH